MEDAKSAAATLMKSKSQINPKGPPSIPEKKSVNEDIHRRNYYTSSKQGVALVLMMKKILDNSRSESEWVVCDSLKKLESMDLSVKTLEITMIGKTVSALKKQGSSEKVRGIAERLVKSWKRTADEYYSLNKHESEVVEQKSLQQPMKSTNVVNVKLGKKKLEELGSEKGVKVGINGGVVVDCDEKLEDARRKLRERYEEAEKVKKKRRIQVMEVHEVVKQGLLLPQKNRSWIKNQNRQIGKWRRC